MPGRIRQEDIAAVRERSPIVEVVGEYLQLRPAGGGNLTGLCPFHDEKSPSFNVTPGKELFHCFGCQMGGDVIRFIMEIEALQFAEAVERLAARCGVELRYEGGGYVPGQERGQRQRLIEASAAAHEFYAGHLSAAPAREFLSQRGFELADAERFGMGYSPDSWDELTRHLRGRRFTDEELVKAGLARTSSRGTLIDMFRGRVMWPIRDLAGDTIAFGARKLKADDNGPKYLNTPETSLFKKGSVLYGADLAKREIGKQRRAVIVEGYTDVMACHLAGVTTAVATCGTAFGADHVKLLRRLILDSEGADGQIIYTFDGDAAGQKAALRSFELEDRFVSQTYVAVQPDGLDPCDLRLARGESAVRDLVERRVPLFEFVIRQVLAKYDLDSADARVAALQETAPIVAQTKDPSKRVARAIALDRWLGFVNENFVVDVVRKEARKRVRDGGGTKTRSEYQEPVPDGDPRPPAYRYNRADPVLNTEREALKLAVQWPALCGPAFDALGAEAFAVPVHASVFGLIAGRGGTAGAGRLAEWVTGLLDAAPDDRARNFVNELAVEPAQFTGEPDDAYAAALVASISARSLGRRIEALQSRVQRMNPADEGYNELYLELINLEIQRKSMRGAA